MIEMRHKIFNVKENKKCCNCLLSSTIEDTVIICKKHGVVNKDDRCRHFKYDPLKREPELPPETLKYSKKDFEL